MVREVVLIGLPFEFVVSESKHEQEMSTQPIFVIKCL